MEAVTRCRLAALVLAGLPAFGQSLVEGARVAAEKEIFDAPPAGQLRCDIREVRPSLNFALRFEAGYGVTIPLQEFDASDHTLTAHVRVTPAGQIPVYLTKSEGVSHVPAVNSGSVAAASNGKFVVGEGAYRVEVLVEDELHRACRSSWQIQARRTPADRQLRLPTPPLTVEDVGAPAVPAPITGPRIGRLTILLHASALAPNAAQLQPADVERLMDSLSSLLRQLPADAVRLTAFNLDQRSVVFHKDGFNADQMGDLLEALRREQLALVDYRTLQRPGRPVDLLIQMLHAEFRDLHPPDAVVLLGPRTRGMSDVPAEAVEKIWASVPMFYLQFQGAPMMYRALASPPMADQRFPGRGTSIGSPDASVGVNIPPASPDVIERLVGGAKGKTIVLRTPLDFAAAIRLMDGRIPHSAAAVPNPSVVSAAMPRKEEQPERLTDPTGGEDPVAVLMQVRDAVLRHGETIPNHTCVELVERQRYAPVEGYAERSCDTLMARRKEPNAALRLTLDHTDWLRLDVGLAPDREIYSWVGARKFAEGEIDELVPEGAIGTGPFAGMLLNIFSPRGPKFVFDGEKAEKGRRLFQYSFTVPLERSTYRVKAKGRWVITGYSGTVLADAATAELARLTIRTDELPPDTGSCENDTILEYGVVQLGAAGYYLPKAARQQFIGRDGSEAANTIGFSACREYRAESAVSFGGDASRSGAAAGGAPALDLPRGRAVTIELRTAVRPGESAAGDRIEGRLLTAVFDDQNRTLVPQGAVVEGRLMRVDMRSAPRAQLTVAIAWETVTVNGAAVPFPVRPNRVPAEARGPRTAGLQRRGIEIEMPLPSEARYGVYHFGATQSTIGFRSEWVTGGFD